ncbi:MDR family MFS transporter [Arenivirga flava]|uniref:MFS transporter n=1 Tax=Arenivirga flava TaxID=1930060 RepID=A0AA37UHP5_9MICO|nr:MDR family MFS transporter [Arenivirga flava]GMA29134.1 MFS transporter [Arenivirga flava]
MTHRQIMLVIVGLMAGMFLSSLNQTVVGTAMKTIADDLQGLSLQAWVTTAFLIVATVSTPIYGKLSDLFGRRPLFIIAIVLFLIGSVLSGFAQDMYQLAGFRAVQGLGAGGLMALPLTIMGDILAPRERAKYQGYFLAVFGVSSVIGPLVGGLLSGVDEILFIDGWRWVFLINLPIGLAALAVVMRFLHLPHQHRTVRIDWWGAAFVMLTVVPLILVAEQGREWGWASPVAILCYALTVAGLVAFIVTEKRMGSDALIPLSVFRSPTFSMATVLGVLVGFGMFSVMMMIPLYLQLVDGATPTEAGWMMLPMIGGLMLASIVSGQIIARTGRYKVFPILGTALLAGAYFFLTFSTYDKPVWFTMIGMALAGLGLGQLMQTLTIASQNSVHVRDMGVATSAATFFRQIGGTLGTAVVFSVLFGRLPETLAAAFGSATHADSLAAALQDPEVLADPANAAILQLLQGGASSAGGALNGDTSFLIGADPRLTAPFLDGFAQATTAVYWIGLAVILVAFVLSFFLKATPLREKSALQEAADERAAAAGAAGSMPVAGTPSSPTDAEADARLEAAAASVGTGAIPSAAPTEHDRH